MDTVPFVFRACIKNTSQVKLFLMLDLFRFIFLKINKVTTKCKNLKGKPSFCFYFS